MVLPVLRSEMNFCFCLQIGFIHSYCTVLCIVNYCLIIHDISFPGGSGVAVIAEKTIVQTGGVCGCVFFPAKS